VFDAECLSIQERMNGDKQARVGKPWSRYQIMSTHLWNLRRHSDCGLAVIGEYYRRHRLHNQTCLTWRRWRSTFGALRSTVICLWSRQATLLD